jgi:hypothetical protein
MSRMNISDITATFSESSVSGMKKYQKNIGATDFLKQVNTITTDF